MIITTGVAGPSERSFNTCALRGNGLLFCYTVTKGGVMVKTASERQATYRAKPDQYRLSMYINGEARAALTALARHRGCSQREVIESLIVAEKNAIVSAMETDDLGRFYGEVTW